MTPKEVWRNFYYLPMWGVRGWGGGPFPSRIPGSSAEAYICLSWISGFPTILSPDLAPAGQNLFLVDASNYGANFFFLHNLFLPCCFFSLLFCSLVIRFSSRVWQSLAVCSYLEGGTAEVRSSVLMVGR